MDLVTRTALRAAAVKAHLIDKRTKTASAAQASQAAGRPVAPLPPLTICHFTRELVLAEARRARVEREQAFGVPAESRQVRRRAERLAADHAAAAARKTELAGRRRRTRAIPQKSARAADLAA